MALQRRLEVDVEVQVEVLVGVDVKVKVGVKLSVEVMVEVQCEGQRQVEGGGERSLYSTQSPPKGSRDNQSSYGTCTTT